MGAHSFQDTSRIKNVNDAYSAAVAEATREYGYDGYNGTISTTRGCKVVANGSLMSEIAAEELSSTRLDKLNKWEHCEAIAIGVPQVVKTIQKSFNMPLTTAGRGGVRIEGTHVAAALGLPLSALAGFKVLESVPKFKTSVVKAGVARKMWVTSEGGFEYPTKAAAIAAARQRLSAPDTWDKVPLYASVRTISVFQRTVNTPEAGVESTLTSWRVKVSAQVADGPLVFDHWLFYGIAAS